MRLFQLGHDLVMTRSFLLVRELGLAHLVTAKDNVEHPLHVAQQFLVWSCGSALEIGDDCGGGVALGGKVLLCHGRSLVVLGLGACLGDGLSDGGANSLRLHDIV